MPDYKSMYFQLFNKITDAINILQTAQQTTEEQYISADEPNITLLSKPDVDSEDKT